MYRNLGVRPVLEDMRGIDVREWVRGDLLSKKNFLGNWKVGNREVPGYGCIPRAGHVFVTYHRARETPAAQRIMLDTTPCNFGGERLWFRCPRCQHRCAILYLIRERLICRNCSQLPYLVQQVGAVNRLIHKRNKINARLGGNLPPKIRGQLQDELVKVEDQVYESMAKGTYRLTANDFSEVRKSLASKFSTKQSRNPGANSPIAVID